MWLGHLYIFLLGFFNILGFWYFILACSLHEYSKWIFMLLTLSILVGTMLSFKGNLIWLVLSALLPKVTSRWFLRSSILKRSLCLYFSILFQIEFTPHGIYNCIPILSLLFHLVFTGFWNRYHTQIILLNKEIYDFLKLRAMD